LFARGESGQVPDSPKIDTSRVQVNRPADSKAAPAGDLSSRRSVARRFAEWV
jgi:hypothetical protein